MRVLMISPGYPVEMALFTRGLAAAGADVVGLGDQHVDALPATARDALVHHVHAPRLGDTDAVVAQVLELARHVRIDRVECLWEPYVLLAARLREVLGLPGMTVAQTVPFRDKEVMKNVIDAAGIRTPWHRRAHTAAEVRQAVAEVGFPAIVKPIAGAGSASTYRVDSESQLEAVLPALRHVAEVSVEEFVDAEEFTYDTVCAGGRVLFENVCVYRPRPLIARQNEWISPVTVALRDLDAPELAGGIAMGHAVLQALGFTDGFTHMEWYRRPDGEVVFGEIGCRPPGGRTVDLMNYVVDGDLYRGWASAMVHGELRQPTARRYNAASIFKRASGQGRIVAIEGLGRLLSEHGEHVVALDLLPIGAPRRDWLQVLISDGMIVVRHPDLATCYELAEIASTEVRLYAA